jgi:hypothetical protein
MLLSAKDKLGSSVVDRFATRMNFRLAHSAGTNLSRSEMDPCDEGACLVECAFKEFENEVRHARLSILLAQVRRTRPLFR